MARLQVKSGLVCYNRRFCKVAELQKVKVRIALIRDPALRLETLCAVIRAVLCVRLYSGITQVRVREWKKVKKRSAVVFNEGGCVCVDFHSPVSSNAKRKEPT
jgi:hypothetical protein